VVEEYMKAMNEIGLVIMRSAVRILGLPLSELDKYFHRPFSLLRFIHYPAAGGSKLGVGEHTDYGFLTMILQDHRAPGLEARAYGKDRPWVPVPPVPDTFAVNIGDAMESWSGGKFRATPHRVVNTSLEHGRLSVPFFFEPSLESVFGHAAGGAGNGLTHNGQEPVQCYGDHLYRAYIRSYPFLGNHDAKIR
jgi:isopenicillin N synthase-like dioxygenase